MLLRVPLLVLFISMVRGTVIAEQSQEVRREGKGLDSAAWQYLFDILYFNKTKGPEPYKGGNVTITEDTGFFSNPKSTKKVTNTTNNTRRGRRRESVVIVDPEIIIDLDPVIIVEETIAYNATVPITPDVVQIKVHIKYLQIRGPVDGDCEKDVLVITGTNPGPEIPVLCGSVINQTLYLDVDNVVGPVLFTMRLSITSSIDQMWNITITKLKEADSVPRRCLQYYTTTTGKIMSFNYGGTPTNMMLTDQTYSICFGYVVGYCQIAFTANSLDIGIHDGDCTDGNYLFTSDEKYCGRPIKTDYPLIIKVNATGPISIGVRSSAVAQNLIRDKGFSATYMMLGC